MMNRISILYISAVILISGCCQIGVESVSTYQRQTETAKIDQYILSNKRPNAITIFDPNTDEGISVTNRSDVISVLGEPDQEHTKSIRYYSNRRLWGGYALDLVVVPIPLTIPLMYPKGKGGYVDIIFEEDAINEMIEYKSSSLFYGFHSDSSGGQVYKWEPIGMWLK